MTPTKIPVSRDWDLASCEISAITDPAYNTKPSPLHTTKLPLPAPKRFPQVTLFELSRAPNRDDIASFFGYKVEVERSTSRYPSPLYGVTTTMVSAEQAASTRATVYRSFADFRLLHSALFRVFPGILLPPPPTADNQSTLDTFIFSVLTSSRSNHLRTFQSPDALISSPPVESFLYEAEKRFAESLRLHYASDRKQAAKVAAALNKPPKSSRDTMNGLTLLADMIPSCISPNLQHFLAACTAPSAGEGHIKRDSSGTSGMVSPSLFTSPPHLFTHVWLTHACGRSCRASAQRCWRLAPPSTRPPPPPPPRSSPPSPPSRRTTTRRTPASS